MYKKIKNDTFYGDSKIKLIQIICLDIHKNITYYTIVPWRQGNPRP